MENYQPPMLEKRETENQDVKLLRGNIATIDTLLRLENKEDIRQFSVLTFCGMFLANPAVEKILEQDRKESLNERVRNLRGKVGAKREEQDYVELGAIIGEVREIFEQIT